MQTFWTDIDGPVHAARLDGPADGPTFVLVHGLGGAHTNWLALAPLLAQRGAVFAPDFPGFGRTPSEGRRATVDGARGFLSKFIKQETSGPVILVGNSMGGLLSILQTSAEPDTVSGLVLIDPALPRRVSDGVDATVARLFATYLVPKVGEAFIAKRLKAAGPERIAEETLRLCTVDPATVPEDVRAAAVALAIERASMPWATHAFLEAARSLIRTLARRTRVFAAMKNVSAPTLMIAGAQDRLVSIGTMQFAAQAHADWDFVVLDHCGHVPMLEDAPRVSAEIQRWIDGPARRMLSVAHEHPR
jgi:pimeloyl-ACP methyl ester carboxylesterase